MILDIKLVVSCIVILGLCARWLLQTRNSRKTKSNMIHHSTPRNSKIIDKCITLQSEYVYPVWGSNGHLQTFFASVLRRTKKNNYHRELFHVSDGGVIILDWLFPIKCDNLDETPIVFIVPGLCNTSASHYISHFAECCTNRGYRCVTFTPRGCGEHLTTPKLFSYGDSSDVRECVEHVHSRFPEAHIVGAGFSMGANMLIKYVGESGDDTPMIGVVSVSQGYDARKGIKYVTEIPLYHFELTRKLKRLVHNHKHKLKDTMDVDHVLKRIKTVHDFDTLITCHLHGIESPEKYYHESGCVHHLENIKRPCLLLNALDDPLVPEYFLPYEAAKRNEHIIMVTTPYGGHLGWATVKSPDSLQLWPEQTHWYEKASIEFIDAVLETHS